MFSFSCPPGHWSAMNTPWFTCSQSSSFCHLSSVSVRGRAWSPVHPLSAANLVCLSGEGLDHHCGCSSSLSAADLMHLSGGRAGSLLPPCLGTNTNMSCVRGVGSDFIGDAVSGTSTVQGMYKCGGLCWVSTDVCVAAQTSAWARVAVASLVLGLSMRGRHAWHMSPFYLQKRQCSPHSHCYWCNYCFLLLNLENGKYQTTFPCYHPHH